SGHRRQHEERDEKANASIGDHRAGDDDREDSAPRAQLLADVAGDGLHRSAVVHQFPEQRAEQEDGEELREESRGAGHEGLRPVREQRLARERGGGEGGERGEQQHAPASVRKTYEEREREQDADESHGQSPSSSSSRSKVERLPRSLPCATTNASA